MSFATFLDQLFAGLGLGFILFFSAAGLNLVWGVLGVMNFAAGAVYMLGAYLATTVIGRVGRLHAGMGLGARARASAGRARRGFGRDGCSCGAPIASTTRTSSSCSRSRSPTCLPAGSWRFTAPASGPWPYPAL